jgi:hypothetical protein
MFKKFNTDEIKKNIKEKLSETTSDLRDVVISVNNDESDRLKDSKIYGLAKDALGDLNLTKKVKDFSINAANIAAEIDEYLLESNSPYEVSTFRVSANLGVTAGMTLDMHFAKTPFAKKFSAAKSEHMVIKNPTTEKHFKVPRESLLGADQAKVRDPLTGDIFLISTFDGKVIEKCN